MAVPFCAGNFTKLRNQRPYLSYLAYLVASTNAVGVSREHVRAYRKVVLGLAEPNQSLKSSGVLFWR